MRDVLTRCAVAAVLSCTGIVSAADWIESVNGDLSDDTNNPTPVSFSLGDNRVIGTMGTPPGGSTDADIFTFTIAPGLQLTSILIESLSGTEASFYAIAAGPIITFVPNEHLSNILISNTGEIMDDLANPIYGGPGITAPLGAGQYTVWWQETAEVRDYTFRYTLTEVPEPVGAGTLLLTSLLAARRRRRDRNIPRA
jgi:hypothetical protein